MDVDSIIRLLSELISEGETAFARRHGKAALDVAREIQAAVMEQFEHSLSYVVLWEQFLQTPGEVSGAVAGVVRSRMDDNPLLADWLQVAWVRYRDSAGGKI